MEERIRVPNTKKSLLPLNLCSKINSIGFNKFFCFYSYFFLQNSWLGLRIVTLCMVCYGIFIETTILETTKAFLKNDFFFLIFALPGST